ncbi:polyprotein [Carpediemonas membranifera]|uniref:Polyprotein n=1 Tax=Carpediemonas membranifera TaxID=201153 RepID=A0A8J6E391_9EUKA|nr:polyprotein [Carpediemonas membranifera]|eukprot:KAG9395633.1 polyprotein [Carpediemonas membranifera]
MRIFTDNLRPKPFKEVMKFKKAERKPTAMDDLQRLALRVAKRDDNAREEALRYGYYAQSSTPANNNGNTGPSGDNTRQPARPCRHCQGNHFDRDCPSRQSRGPQTQVNFAKSRGADALKVPASCGTSHFQAIIDTGAAISCTSDRYAKIWQLPRTSIDPVSVILADGSSITVNQAVDAPILFTGLAGFPVAVSVRFIILPGRQCPLIGCDTLRDLGVLTSDGLSLGLTHSTPAADDVVLPVFSVSGSRLQSALADYRSGWQSVQIPSDELRSRVVPLLREFSDIFEPLGPEPANVPPWSCTSRTIPSCRLSRAASRLITGRRRRRS